MSGAQVLDKDYFGETPLGWRREVREALKAINAVRGHIGHVVGTASAVSAASDRVATAAAVVIDGTSKAATGASDFFAGLDALRRNVYPRQQQPVGARLGGGTADVRASKSNGREVVPRFTPVAASRPRGASLADFELRSAVAAPSRYRRLEPADPVRAAAEDARHTLPAATMGDFLSVISRRSVLRDPLLEPTVMVRKRRRTGGHGVRYAAA